MSAFGTGLDDAYQVAAGRRLRFWIQPPVHGAAFADLVTPCDACVRLRLAVVDGRITITPRG